MPCVAEVVNRSLKADCTDYRHKLIDEARDVKTETILAGFTCLYFVKNHLKHSGRTGITSIAMRGLALVP